jgi:protease IV
MTIQEKNLEMSMNPDQIIDRRRLRRKLTFWRVSAFIFLIGLIVAFAAAAGVFERFGERGSDHIARVAIKGAITNERNMIELFDELGKKSRVKAVLLDISSPGGTTVGGETLFNAIRELAGKKPVVTSVGTLAASAGYMIACASDHIVAHRSSLLGSIGVLIQYGDAAELLEKIGVNVDAVKSSPLKAAPSPFEPASEEARQMLARVVDDTYEWFVSLVADRRSLDQTRVRQLADGSIFTGAQSLENGLIDQIGDEETARKWLVENRSIDENLKIVEWKPKAEDDGLVSNPVAIMKLVRLFGIEIDARSLQHFQDAIEKRLFLDGLISRMPF